MIAQIQVTFSDIFRFCSKFNQRLTMETQHLAHRVACLFRNLVP